MSKIYVQKMHHLVYQHHDFLILNSQNIYVCEIFTPKNWRTTGGFQRPQATRMEMSALRALRLEEPLDFSEGDHGLSGGIQVPWYHEGI